MGHQITITYPEKLAFSLKMEDVEFAKEIKIISLVKLYELGKISSGLAAKILDMDSIDFLELLNKYNVSYINQNLKSELPEDIKNA